MTIAQQLNVTTFPFTIKNKDDNPIYWETSNGYWFNEFRGTVIKTPQ